MTHPAWRYDGQALAVGDVVVGAQGMLNSMHRPARFAVSKGIDAIAAEGAGEHHLGTGGIVLRILKTLPGIDHQALQAGLAESVIKQCRVFAEILFHDMVHGICTACSSLFLRYGERVAGVQK